MCVVRHMTKSDNRLQILRWHYQLGMLSCCYSLPPRLILNENGIPSVRCLQESATSHNDSCLGDVTGQSVKGQNHFKIRLTTEVTRLHAPWLVSMDSNEKPSLQKQSPHLPWIEVSQRGFHQEHPCNWTVACLCKQDKMCRCVSVSKLGPLPAFF
jgi:hypothetical protein